MSHPERDDEFEAFLKHRTVLPHGVSVDDKLEPPHALDEKVLRKAREAIHADKQSQRAPRWAMPMAIAATVLLCLSIALNVSLNTNRPVADQQRLTVANADKPVAESRADDANALDSVSVTAQRREAGERKAADAAGAIAQTNTGGADTNGIADAKSTGAGTGRARAESVPDAKLAAVRPPVLADAQSPAFGSMAAPEAAIEGVPATEPRPADATPAAPPSAFKEELPPPALAANELEESVAVTGTRRLAKSKSEGYTQPAERSATSATAAAAPPAAAPAVPPAPAATTASHPKDAKTWLKRIDALRSQGRTGAADAEMQRFRAAFPNYPVKPAAPASGSPHGAAPPPPVPNDR